MSAESAGAVDATTEPATESTVAEQSTPTFADILTQTALETGHTIRGAEAIKAEPEPEPEPESTEEVDTEPVEEIPDVAEGVPEDQDAAPTDDKKDEWPQSAKKRVAEESAKRKHDREVVIPALQTRAETAEAKVQQLEAQLASSTGPAPTPDNPLVDVHEPQKLVDLKKQYQLLRATAEKVLIDVNNRVDEDGMVSLGKNAKGDEIRMTPEQIVEVKLNAEKMVNEDIPKRAAFLDARAKANVEAISIYPQFKDPNSEMTKQVIAIVKANPMLEAYIGPDALTWIGDAVYRRLERMNGNGKAQSTDVATTVAKAAKTKIAPTPTKARSPVERTRGADLAKLQKTFKERKDSESAENLIGAILSKRGTSANQLRPIAE